RDGEARHETARVTREGEPLMTLRAIGAWSVILLLLAGGLSAQKFDSAAAMLRAATDKAQVDGDLKAAIRQYQAIVDKFAQTDRAVVAQALVRMAECYQKLGDAQAQTTYQRVVRDFADQKDTAEIARTRLDIPAASPREAATRRVWTAPPGAELEF